MLIKIKPKLVNVCNNVDTNCVLEHGSYSRTIKSNDCILRATQSKSLPDYHKFMIVPHNGNFYT